MENDGSLSCMFTFRFQRKKIRPVTDLIQHHTGPEGFPSSPCMAAVSALIMVTNNFAFFNNLCTEKPEILLPALTAARLDFSRLGIPAIASCNLLCRNPVDYFLFIHSLFLRQLYFADHFSTYRFPYSVSIPSLSGNPFFCPLHRKNTDR